MALVALVIVAATAAGVAAERRWRGGAEALARRLIDMMLWVLMPPIVFIVMARVHFGAGVGAGLVLGYVELAVVGTLAYLAGTRLLHLPRPAVGSLVCVVIVVNTGYLGTPLNAAVLGSDAVGPAVVWDIAVSNLTLYTAGFAVGAAFGTRAGETTRERAIAFATRNPVLLAVIAGLLAPEALAPDEAFSVVKVLVYVLVPVGFFVLGVNLTHERDDGSLSFPPPFSAPVAVAVILRLLVAPGLMLLLSRALARVPDAYLVQAGMASGINGLVVAHLYGLDIRLTASVIAWSTAIVVGAALAVVAVV